MFEVICIVAMLICVLQTIRLANRLYQLEVFVALHLREDAKAHTTLQEQIDEIFDDFLMKDEEGE